MKYTKEELRMQMLAGIITEGQYKIRLNESNESYINSLLEKIFDKGIESLTSEEKEYLDNTSQGKNSKNPDEILQDLFNEWKIEEIEVGNDIENIYHWSDLHKSDPELQDGFISYVNLVKKYPNLNKEDLAILNSLSYIKDFAGTQDFTDWNSIEWNSLDEKTYLKILKDDYGIEPKEDEDDDGEKLDYPYEDRENFRKILEKIESQHKDWEMGKIKDEARKQFKKLYKKEPHQDIIRGFFSKKSLINPSEYDQIKILKSLGFKGDPKNDRILKYSLPNDLGYWVVPSTYSYSIMDPYGKTIKEWDRFYDMIDYFKSTPKN